MSNLAQVYCNLRISELYDIIADFPDSLTAVHEVRRARRTVVAM